MLRDIIFCEFEVVRVEDGEPSAPAWRLDFSMRPLTYVLGGLFAAAAVLTAFLSLPSPAPYGLLSGSLCGNGDYSYDPDGAETSTPPIPDSTRLVRRPR
jgi:hypothetical protein